MSKFNSNAMAAAVSEYEDMYGGEQKQKQNPTHTVREVKNLAEGEAFALSKELALYSRVCTMGLSDKSYESENDQMKKLVELIRLNDPLFVAKLAVYAREKMYLRTIPLVLTVELAKIHRGDNLVSSLISRVVKRADEITELLAYYQVANNRQGQTKKLNKLSNQVKRGIREVFQSGRFDEYQFAKYNRGTEVKFRDALFLTHPKPKDAAQKSLFEGIVNDTLEVPYTWETQLSDAGQTDKDARVVWEELIESGKLGYMAMMRNLRNFLKENISQKHITMVCRQLSDRSNVLHSKQLPFRFFSAYRSLVSTSRGWGYSQNDLPEYITKSPYVGDIVTALEHAISHSVDNMPMFIDEEVLCATDVSGSMMQPVSQRSVIEQFDIGALLCMIAKQACENSQIAMFGESFKLLDQKGSDILASVGEIRRREGEVGYSTNGYKVLDHALKSGKSFDRIMIFTDCQLYGNSRSRYGRYDDDNATIDTLWKLYKTKNPQAKLYFFDLSGYGSVPIRMMENDVYVIAGWSDKVFDIMKRIEMGGSAIDEIESITL